MEDKDRWGFVYFHFLGGSDLEVAPGTSPSVFLFHEFSFLEGVETVLQSEGGIPVFKVDFVDVKIPGVDLFPHNVLQIQREVFLGPGHSFIIVGQRTPVACA